tara:strand:+ start:1294 stop:1620 length:327 start_codon:yes stop_codon:yes gene_type:complete
MACYPYKENIMNNIKNVFFGMFFVIFAQGCATVGTVIDGGKELATNTVDVVVGTASDVAISVAEDVSDISTTALEVGAGVVQTVSDEIDKQTDELQEDSKEEKPEEKK